MLGLAKRCFSAEFCTTSKCPNKACAKGWFGAQQLAVNELADWLQEGQDWARVRVSFLSDPQEGNFSPHHRHLQLFTVRKAAASGVGRKGETVPWGKGNEKVGPCPTGEGNGDWCHCGEKGCGNLECFRRSYGSKELLLGAGVGQWESGRGHGVFQAKVVAEASLGS